MTAFDYAAGLLLIVSGLVGLARGATREVTTVVAFFFAAILSVFALRYSAPIVGGFIHAAWLANVAAVLTVFIVAYIVLRLIGGSLTRSVRETSLSGLDRLLGLALGLVRGVVVLGGFALLLNAAMPPERMPRWIAEAKLFPLASAAGGALRAFAPRGMKMAHDVAPALTNAVTGVSTDPDTQPKPPHGRRRPSRTDASRGPSAADSVEDSR